MRCTILCALLATAIGLIGCGGKPVSSTIGVGDLDVKIWASTDCAEANEPVTIRATVTNTGSRTFSVELKDQPVFDLIVTDQNGEHRWSAGKPLTPDLTRLELKPGQSKTIKMQWIATNSLVVSARFIYSPEETHLPVSPDIVIFTIPNCPGGI